MADKTVVVHREQGLPRAHVVKAHLESAGIPAILSYESAGPALGVTVDGLGEVEIRVPAQFAARARRVLTGDAQLPAHGPRRRVRRNLKARRYPPEQPTDT